MKKKIAWWYKRIVVEIEQDYLSIKRIILPT